MGAIDVNSLFGRAEQAFAAGRFEAARADVKEVERLAGQHPAVLHLLALIEKKCGDLPAARQAFQSALHLAPEDPQINNNFANLLDQLGEHGRALAHFDRAVAASPGLIDARFNRALLLQRLGRLEEALSEMERVASMRPGDPRIQSARGSLFRALGRLDEGAAAYDAALRLQPERPTALHGRARIAMERGEIDASERFRRALAVTSGDPMLRLGLAEALEAEGKPGAVECLAEAVAERPEWVEGQAALARMRWEAGEGTDFTRDLEHAVAIMPQNRDLWLAYAAALADADLSADAADAAARGGSAVGGDVRLSLLEALHASESGQLERADALYEAMPDLPGRSVQELRHRLRQKDYARAHELALEALSEEPWSVTAWAMTGLTWRLTDDPRADWLLAQPGLIGSGDLALDAGEAIRLTGLLRSLHRTRAHPIGQSLRGGTQTRGRLFDRQEPEIRGLRDRLAEAVLRHWNALPDQDPGHPLLRHRASAPRFDGSWSVRLTDGGFHVAHIHPHGVLSSACYFTVPEPIAPQEGWLEIGGPPTGLDLPLEPLARIEPRAGRVALFPSYMYHGTRPFSAGERLTVAFDVVAA
jgi:tetratricopeptide (TPR) repeat protein